jgi:hypothetical protein
MALREFFAPLATQKVDPANGVIYGVSVITSGIKARGHDLEVDSTTLSQIKECAEKLGTVPVKWNHRTGADAVAGYLENFRIEGGKLLGDWHLLKTHAQYGQAIEMAQRMPRNVGLSAAFMGEDEMSGGAKKARCSELISVDLVAQPAANPDGLFEAKFPGEATELGSQVDTSTNNRMDENNQTNTNAAAQQGPSMEDLLAALNQLSEQVAAQQETIAALQGAGNEEADEITLEEIMSLSEQDIADLLQAGEITEEDAAGIQAYQAEVVAALEAEEAGEGQEGELATAGAAADGSDSSSTGSSAELSALQNQVRELSARFEREDAAAENAEIEHYFSTIEGNLTQLAEEKAALTELSEKLAAENEALRAAVKTGTRPLAFSAEGRVITGARGELHEFESRVKTHTEAGKTHAQAVMLAHKENPEAHQDWIRQQSK